MRRAQSGEFRFSETYYPPGAQLPAHSHHHWYLCFVRRGCYEETFDGCKRFCQPWTVAAHPAGETHSERFLGSPTYSFNVEGPGEWHRPAVVLGGEAARIAAELYQAFTEDNREALESLSLELLAEMQGSAEPLRSEPSWLRMARECIEDMLPQSMQLSGVATMVGVKPAHLATAFRRVHGCTAGDYLRRLRVEQACRLLAQKGQLAEIALDCGFCDQSHFTRTFHQMIGVTPAAYRNML
ncbi:MAG: helix-turn-helix transcriptional regulator [Acidobacteria bacterium]|nr:helix-turn-helix transcriptional regulator [Acidobacteriota bacterium]